MSSSVEEAGTAVTKMPVMARMFLQMLEKIQVGSVEITTPDGSTLCFRGESAGPQAQLHLRDWSACADILRSGDIGVAEAYRDHRLETPDLLAVLLLALANLDVLEQALHGNFLGTFLYRMRHLFNRNTRAGSRKNIHAHYDIGNSFYRLWLDPSMTYSAGLFTTPDCTLESAQHAKYERLLDQLGIQPGDHILEIGCGWGALAEYAANERGCHVTGVSLSREQLAWARERVKGTAAESRTQFSYRDYRDLNGHYDAVVSIEMFEAVGEQYWPLYFSKIRSCLRPGARAAIQTITIDDSHFEAYRKGTDFIQQYIFPGGMLPSPSRFAKEVGMAGLELTGLFEFGPDYATTLRLWRHNFEAALGDIRALGFDEAFIRIWRFYLCYCEAGFLTRRTSVCQAVLSAPGVRA